MVNRTPGKRGASPRAWERGRRLPPLVNSHGFAPRLACPLLPTLRNAACACKSSGGNGHKLGTARGNGRTSAVAGSCGWGRRRRGDGDSARCCCRRNRWSRPCPFLGVGVGSHRGEASKVLVRKVRQGLFVRRNCWEARCFVESELTCQSTRTPKGVPPLRGSRVGAGYFYVRTHDDA